MRVIFTRPSNQPSSSFLASMPASCVRIHCKEKDCAPFLFHEPATNPRVQQAPAFMTLAQGTSMIRTKCNRRILCNRWGCGRGYFPCREGTDERALLKMKFKELPPHHCVLNYDTFYDSTESYGKHALKRCQGCMEVAYCSKEHQVRSRFLRE